MSLTLFQNELIKDRIKCDVQNPTVRDRLLRCDDLNLDKAIKVYQVEKLSQESGRQLSSSGECSNAVLVHGVERLSASALRHACLYLRYHGHFARMFKSPFVHNNNCIKSIGNRAR